MQSGYASASKGLASFQLISGLWSISLCHSRPKTESWIKAVPILLPLILPSFGSEGDVLNRGWKLNNE